MLDFGAAPPQWPMSRRSQSALLSWEEVLTGFLLSEDPTIEAPNYSVFLDTWTILALSKRKCPSPWKSSLKDTAEESEEVGITSKLSFLEDPVFNCCPNTFVTKYWWTSIPWETSRVVWELLLLLWWIRAPTSSTRFWDWANSTNTRVADNVLLAEREPAGWWTLWRGNFLRKI